MNKASLFTLAQKLRLAVSSRYSISIAMTNSMDEFDYMGIFEAPERPDDTPQDDDFVTEFVFPVIPSY